MQTFTGIQYLKMDIAASFGLSDKTWGERLSWFADNEADLENLVKQADEPAQFLAGVMAYRKTLKGEASGYLCGLDATASGLQLLSLLAGCEQSASICNLLDTGRREDAYVTVHSHMNQLLETSVACDRKPVKSALMKHLYGSKAEPKISFGEDTPQLRAFYQTIDDLLPGADQLNKDLIGLWNDTALAHTWTLPDGFDVVVKVMDDVEHQVTFNGKAYTITEEVNRPVEGGLAMGANIVHSIDGMVVREMNRRCNFTANTVIAIQDLLESGCFGGRSAGRRKDLSLLRILALHDTSDFLSAAILEYLDELNIGHLDARMRQKVASLIDSMPMTSFPVLCIHDCFKFHANYGNDVRIQYKQILAELAQSNILSAIASEITGRTIHATKLSQTLPAKILASEYAIC